MAKYNIPESSILAREPAAAYQKIEKTLKVVDKIGDDRFLMEMSIKGIPFATFEKATATLPFSLQDWADYLNMPIRTLYRYKQESRVFKDHYAERILGIIRLVKEGAIFFDELEHFYEWLNIPNPALSSRRPKEFLLSSFGIQILTDLIGQMKHGIFA